jgi:hypothetical protein
MDVRCSSFDFHTMPLIGQPTGFAHAVQCRARLASVCRRWRCVSTSTHAAVVWRTLSVDESALGRGASIYYDSLVRWCHQRGRHIRDLEFILAASNAHVRGPS